MTMKRVAVEEVDEERFMGTTTGKITLVLAVLAIHLLSVLALWNNVYKALPLVSAVVLGYVVLTYFYLSSRYPKLALPDASQFMEFEFKGVKVAKLAPLVPISLLLLYVLIDAAHSPLRLRSISGLFTCLLLGVLCSANPARIRWRPVLSCMFAQLCVGMLVLRWEGGHRAFRWASDKIVTFLYFTRHGTSMTYSFVANPPQICGMSPVFLYAPLQNLLYFAVITGILYHWGVMQWVLKKTAFLMKHTLGTTAAESVNAIACIFVGQTEAALLIAPAFPSMTDSEAHSVMAAGFACISGSLFSAYIAFGACPSYLLSATVMSATVSLAISKVIYPEIQRTKQGDVAGLQFRENESETMLGCISRCAIHAAKLVIMIGANLVVFTALLAFLNDAVAYLGGLVGWQGMSFNKLLGYAFFPLAYMMGASDASDAETELAETLLVAELMGMKTVLNEFIAYVRLAELIRTGALQGARAQMIATYALCGFANFGMIGCTLAVLTGICPQRRQMFARLVLRSLIAGCLSCFMTACMAGILVEVPSACPPTDNSHCVDVDTIREQMRRWMARNVTQT